MDWFSCGIGCFSNEVERGFGFFSLGFPVGSLGLGFFGEGFQEYQVEKGVLWKGC